MLFVYNFNVSGGLVSLSFHLHLTQLSNYIFHIIYSRPSEMTNLVIKYSLLSFPVASLGLGYWQIQRLEWKKGVIATLEKQIKDEPIDLLAIYSAKELENLEYRRVKVKGRYDPDPTHQLYLRPRALVVSDEAIVRGRTAHQSNNGVNVITPFKIEGTDLRILVNRGWLADRGKDSVEQASHLGLDSQEPVEVSGVVRKTDTRTTYGMKNDLTTNKWQIRDIPAMAKALNTAPIYIEADPDVTRTSGPIGGQTQLHIRNEHLNYAITWFSLGAFSFLMWYSRYGKVRLFGRGNKTKQHWR